MIQFDFRIFLTWVGSTTSPRENHRRIALMTWLPSPRNLVEIDPFLTFVYCWKSTLKKHTIFSSGWWVVRSFTTFFIVRLGVAKILVHSGYSKWSLHSYEGYDLFIFMKGTLLAFSIPCSSAMVYHHPKGRPRFPLRIHGTGIFTIHLPIDSFRKCSWIYRSSHGSYAILIYMFPLPQFPRKKTTPRPKTTINLSHPCRPVHTTSMVAVQRRFRVESRVHRSRKSEMWLDAVNAVNAVEGMMSSGQIIATNPPRSPQMVV